MNWFIICSLLIIILFFAFANFQWKRLINRLQIGARKQNRKGYGYIYFYNGRKENPFLVKIGRTNNVLKRMDAARTSNPHGINLMAVVRVKDDVQAESFIHKKFEKYRLPRNEWFGFRPSVYWYMLTVKDKKLTREFQKELERKQNG